MLWLALKLVFFTRPPGLWSVIKPDNIGCDIKIQNDMKRLDGEMKPCVIYVFGLAWVCSIYYICAKVNLSRMIFCISSVSSIWTDIFVFHRRNTKNVKTTFPPPHWIAYQDSKKESHVASTTATEKKLSRMGKILAHTGLSENPDVSIFPQNEPEYQFDIFGEIKITIFITFFSPNSLEHRIHHQIRRRIQYNVIPYFFTPFHEWLWNTFS